MAKNKHKITKEVQDKIYELAKSLPKMHKQDTHGNPVYKNGEVDGQVLLDWGQKAKGNEDPIPGVRYTNVPILQYENHVQNLVDAFQKEGQSGMDYYVHNVKEWKTLQEEMAEASRPVKPNFLTRLFKLFRGS